MRHILGPVSAVARIQRNASKTSLGSKDGPRFHIEVLLEDLALTLTDKEYKIFVELLDDVSRYFRSAEHKKWRPTTTVKQK